MATSISGTLQAATKQLEIEPYHKPGGNPYPALPTEHRENKNSDIPNVPTSPQIQREQSRKQKYSIREMGPEMQITSSVMKLEIKTAICYLRNRKSVGADVFYAEHPKRNIEWLIHVLGTILNNCQ